MTAIAAIRSLRRWRSLGGAWAMLMALGCGPSTPPPRVDPLFKDGVRQRPLDDAEAERLIRRNGPLYEACYRREMMNLSANLSAYVFRVWIPTDGSGADVEAVRETVPGQTALRQCLVEALERVDFPAHTGEPMTLNVPMKGPT